ncbi:unnamed protein product [marine sediment metagenome]|uniref:Uncharacterized protein n=1 Tax=marine sediment metagenome TaxID=412755 RepID=X1EJI2_9ZZZZ
MKIIEVTWVDAMIETSHLEGEAMNLLAPLERHNVGYLFFQDDVQIIITSGTIDNLFKGTTGYDMGQSIPMRMVKDIKVKT